MQLGATLYFNQVNARGGVNGRKIVLKTLDDGYEPPNAVANTKKLINEERVFALFGYVGTPTSNASMPIFTEARVPFFGPVHRRRVPAQPAQPLHLPRARELLRRDRGDRAAPDRHEREQDRGLLPERRLRQAGLAGVERALKKRNMEVTAKATVERNTVDVKAAVDAMVKAQPQAWS
jgi:hypothetical protein